MNCAVVAVGRMKEKPYRQMADEYLKRLSRFGKFEECEVQDLPEPEHSSPAVEDQIKSKEGEEILHRLKPGDYVIAMTIGGKQRGSEQLAAHLNELNVRGVGRIVFIIGGSLGLSPQVIQRADEEMSMGPMTFPHQLARVMLLEQIFRSMKINAGERYHK